MRNIPTIGNDAVRVVNMVFVFDVPKDKTREVARRKREERCEKIACGLHRSTLIGHVERSNVIPVELIMKVRVRRSWNAKTLLGDPFVTNNHMFCMSVYVIPWVV
jgi:hypothetical protein